MPTYSYECENCGHFEAWQKVTEKAYEKCPQCGGVVRRMIGRNIGVIFKGTGFYTTDYGPSSRSVGASANSSNNGVSTPTPPADESLYS